MKKIIYLLTFLIAITLTICACDEKTLNSNVDSEKNHMANQIENTNNLENVSELKQNENTNKDDTLEQNSNENNLENLIENQKESGNKTIEVVEKNEEKAENKKENVEKEETSQSQSILVSATALSNKTNAWGFVRKKNEVRPEFAAQYIKVLDDYEGIYAGNPDEKVIYLTFDEGYENGYTGAILDTLKEKECPATFFVTKPYVKQNQDLVKRMIDEGHIVR